LYTLNKHYFSVPNLENCYWAGFIAADGCLWTRGDAVEISLQEADVDHLKLLAKHVGFNGPIEKCKHAGSFPTTQCRYRLTFYKSQVWHKDLGVNFNVTPRKSLTLQPPPLSGEFALAFIIGYIDGDGCFSYCKRDHLNIFTVDGTQQMLEWIKTIFDNEFPSNNISVVRQSTKGKQCIYRFSGERADRMKNKLSQLQTPKMYRKWSL
jgi:hypothetical protein